MSEKSPRRQWTVWLVVVGATLAGGWLIYRWRTPDQPPSRFSTGAVDRGRIVARVTATGALSALVTVQVGSQVSGRIKEIYVDFNSPVKRGQVLARIDPQLFEAALQQALANHRVAEAERDAAKVQARIAAIQLQRTKSLAQRQMVSPADLDAAQANAEAAEASAAAAEGRVAQTQAALHQARINLAYTTIASPIQGSVVSRDVDVGQTVAASLQAPTLFQLAEDLRKMQVDTHVAESDIGKLQPGMSAEFGVDAYPGRRFGGVVRQLRNAPQTLQNVVTYDAVIDVDNADLALKPGMTANVVFVYADKPAVLRVPNAALRFRMPPELAATLAAPAASARRSTAVAGRRPLWLLRGDTPVQQWIRTGVTDGSHTEIVVDPATDGGVGDDLPQIGERVITEVTTTTTGGAPPPSAMRRMF